MNTQSPTWAVEAAKEIAGLFTRHENLIPHHQVNLDLFAAIISKHDPQQPLPVSGKTPRTDAALGQPSVKPGYYVHADFARQLELECATERAARELAESLLAQKDQIYLERLDAFEQVTKRAEAAELRIKAYMESVTPEAAGYKAAESRISELEAALNTEKENVTILRAQRNTLTEAAEAKSGDVEKLRAALVAFLSGFDERDFNALALQPQGAAAGEMSVGDVLNARAALASVPAETITTVEMKQKLDAMVAKAEANPPQVDATLEELASTAAAMILNPHYENYGKAFQEDLRRATNYVAAAISDALIAHARKSQPVNERLLTTAKRAASILPPHCGNPDRASFELDEAIAAAESAAPGESLEAALANALRALLLDTQHEEHSCGAADMNCPVDKARAVLAKFERKTEGAK